jgi:N12 class adenine-specific DNA methylase
MIDVPRLVLTDAETGTRVRHRIRSIKQALKQQEWYEAKLGRRVRIEKVFEDRAAPGKTDSHTGRA